MCVYDHWMDGVTFTRKNIIVNYDLRRYKRSYTSYGHYICRYVPTYLPGTCAVDFSHIITSY